MTQGARSWWKHGVLYQIYPRSFADDNGDGVGDLEGIRKHLDHLQWLGLDGVWISPCFPSPMKDFGYDVADYCDIDPVFGTLADLDRLVEEAHQRGLKVMLDWVPNHSSDQHPWFLASRSSRDNDKRDWYVWRDPAPDGGPPNNWVSVFGGPAWCFDEATGQYYLHSFLKEQPDLNWRNPAVEAAMHDTLRFWLDRGVDGFRIDVVHRIVKDPAMRDCPPSTTPGPHFEGFQHIHDEDHPDIHPYLKRIRAVLDGYDDRALVGEVWIFNPDTVAAYYGDGDELHLAFNFSFLDTPWSGRAFQREIERVIDVLPDTAWPTWVLSNHDVSRTATRYRKDPDAGDERLRVAALMLLTLRGTPWIYYGEEIGLRDVPVPEELWQDPVSWTLGPHKNRDPERSPMPWRAGPGAGFTTAAHPWLPLGADVDERNVEVQRADPGSTLSFFREAIAFRRRHPVLERGDLAMATAPPDVVSYTRDLDGVRACVWLNFSDEEQTVPGPGFAATSHLSTAARPAAPPPGGTFTLGPDEALVVVGPRPEADHG